MYVECQEEKNTNDMNNMTYRLFDIMDTDGNYRYDASRMLYILSSKMLLGYM